jgi:hypothetical protein
MSSDEDIINVTINGRFERQLAFCVTLLLLEIHKMYESQY